MCTSDSGLAAFQDLHNVPQPQSVDSRYSSVVPLDTSQLRTEAGQLHRSVFGYTNNTHAVSPRLLTALLANSGSALGAIDANGRLLGFCFGFTALDGSTVYHYSQSTAVRPESQGMGIGRLLKHRQAELARSIGATSMRWAFDPINARNGHFNLETLGAKGTQFHRDFYGEPYSDRLIADWDLTQEQTGPSDLTSRTEFIQNLAGQPERETVTAGELGGRRWLLLPSSVAASSTLADSVSTLLAEKFIQNLTDGFVAVACQRLADTPNVAAYLFEQAES